ncbi:MAG: general secretion pathway protein GspK [Phycisphaeraceae bacterium]|nr:general secretion pathway protein GspK [Phycisphaeraceae bacterium]MCB9847943.1 general secretion pathway protein GspK [Phycisphaeraceae bacterium]
MGARRPAFALMLVISACAMIFALAISGAVALRSATIEASSMHERAALEREARSAMAVALAGLTNSAESAGDSISTSAETGPGADSTPTSAEELDLPPFPSGLPFEFGGGNDEGDQGSSGSDSDSGSTSKKQQSPKGAFAALRAAGLPSAPLTIEVGGAEFRVTVEDAQGGLDLNRADEQRLIDYFQLVGVGSSTAVEIAQQIVDWRDEDDFLRPHGAERDDYRRANIEIRNAPFQSVEELRYLPAMTPEIFNLVRDDLCVGGDGRTYIGASEAALASVPGISASAVRSIRSAAATGVPVESSQLRDLLGLAADTAGPSLRTSPSGSLRITVEPLSRPGVRLVGEAAVSDRWGVRIGAVSLR